MSLSYLLTLYLNVYALKNFQELMSPTESKVKAPFKGERVTVSIVFKVKVKAKIIYGFHVTYKPLQIVKVR